MKIHNATTIRLALCLFAVVLIAASLGCGSTAPTLQQGPDAELTHDGLARVNRSRLQRAWIKPGTDLSQFSKMVVGPATFRFKNERSSNRRRSAGSDGFYISDANRQRLQDEVSAVFRDELSNSKHFQRVEEAGPDVLLVEGAMLDIVSNVPPQQGGRNDIFLSRVGEATIVLQLADSETGEILARAAERRAAQSPGGSTSMQRSNSVTTWADVRSLARRWARILREQLDAMHELGPIGEPVAAE